MSDLKYDLGDYPNPNKKATTVDKTLFESLKMSKVLDFRIMLIQFSSNLGLDINFNIRINELAVNYDLLIDNKVVCESFCKLRNEVSSIGLLIKMENEYIDFQYVIFYRQLVKEIIKYLKNEIKNRTR